MLQLLAAIAVLATAPSASDSLTAGASATRWTPVVAYDEVQVDVDAARLGIPAETDSRDGTGHDGGPAPGVVHARVRWTFRASEVSPAAWALGVRSSVDLVDVDCVSRSVRTLESRASAADGSGLPSASVATPAGRWQRPAPESVGGQLITGVCDLVRGGARSS